MSEEAAPAARSTSKSASSPGQKPVRITVMGRYEMTTARSELLGQGTSSMCWRGSSLKSGAEVAIKVYKTLSDEEQQVLKQKFKRQVGVLRDLEVLSSRETAGPLWHTQLDMAKPSKLFMQMLDFSRDASGTPGPDPHDGVMYLVTEMGCYSLKDYLRMRQRQGQPLPSRTVQTIAKSIVLAVAALHAKGFVHLDLKPENLMMFDGCLKLIDVDGCMNSGTVVTVDDFSLSFTPCYCAPEWARFLVHPDINTIKVEPPLDAWSVAITMCELATLDPVLRKMFASFLKHGRSRHQAGFLFMDWLSNISNSPWMPDGVAQFDPELADLVTQLLVPDPGLRKGLPDALSHPYLAGAELRKARTGNASAATKGDAAWDATAEDDRPGVRAVPSSTSDTSLDGMPAHAPRHVRPLLEDTSNMVIQKGTLYKLKSAGKPEEENDWVKRDVWITSEGNLSYLSQKEQKRMVMMDGHRFAKAQVDRFTGPAAFSHAFKILVQSEEEGDEDEGYVFGCLSATELEEWLEQIQKVTTSVHSVDSTVKLGPSVVQDLRRFKLAVRNRRQKLGADDDTLGSGDGIFRGPLWKVKTEGDRMQLEDWVERDMGLRADGSLIYWSKKEERQLMYYTGEDVGSAELARISPDDSALPWAFSVQLMPVDGVWFQPGEFAAESEAMREKWMQQFARVAATVIA